MGVIAENIGAVYCWGLILRVFIAGSDTYWRLLLWVIIAGSDTCWEVIDGHDTLLGVVAYPDTCWELSLLTLTLAGSSFCPRLMVRGIIVGPDT